MLNVDGLDIAITRGDTGQFTITFTGDDKPENGCVVIISLKKTKTSTYPQWEKRLTVSNDTVTVTLTSTDTDQAFGQYWWDARIIFRDGTVYTPMNPASFRVLEVIGDAT